MTGDPVDVARAAEIGLVNRVAHEGRALETAIQLAERIAANGPLALIATKRIACGGADWPAEQRWDRMTAIMAPVFASEDARAISEC